MNDEAVLKEREQALNLWANALLKQNNDLAVVSGDASFRRYFRKQRDAGPVILVDCPPDKEPIDTFLSIAEMLKKAKVPVPEVLAFDAENGFLMLSDFGDTLLLATLNADSQDTSQPYSACLDILLTMQGAPDRFELPAYSEAKFNQEALLFDQWFLGELMMINLSESEQKTLKSLRKALVKRAIYQPDVLVHRDYHSRNIMVLPKGLGIIDFQDAVLGPYTYDLVSLLRDCYIKWPQDQVLNWALDFRARWCKKFELDIDEQMFIQDFDWMGMQRHLKAVGIFSRLWLRDGKIAYLQDIPRTMSYICDVADKYPEFKTFSVFLHERVMPSLNSVLESQLKHVSRQDS